MKKIMQLSVRWEVPRQYLRQGFNFKIPFIQNVRRVSKGIKGMPIGYDPETGTSDESESIMITKGF